jgi:integrase
MQRNGWSQCSGMGGHNPAESVDSLQRNEWSQCGGIRMKPGMSESQVRDYTSILKSTLLPRFGKKPFSEFWSRIRMKEFIVELKARKNRFGKPLSGKRIQNIMIPLRVIVKDAIDEYEWYDLHDPFAGLKLPKARKSRIYPFRFQEWQVLRDTMLDWYKPYFDFAVQTGLRPSEQVALKWTDIDDHFIHIERSRVRNKEKDDLKMVEAAGVEPASENIPHRYLHACPDL